jgi:hypothetical protein
MGGLRGLASPPNLRLGDCLRESLRARGWTIVNDTPLPIVCFVDEGGPARGDGRFVEAVARRVIASTGGWISVPRFLPVVHLTSLERHDQGGCGRKASTWTRLDENCVL